MNPNIQGLDAAQKVYLLGLILARHHSLDTPYYIDDLIGRAQDFTLPPRTGWGN